MAGYPVTIKPGPSQQIGGGPPDIGTTFKNQDSKNAVWIGSAQPVTPGNGFKLGPLATFTWNAQGKQPWGCVDTGVVAPVALIVSDDVSDSQDPVATAIAIFETGVPFVLVQDEVFNGSIPATSNIPLDVSRYASIVISTTSPFLTYSFFSSDGTLLDQDVLAKQPGSNRLAVIGPILEIANSSVGATPVIVEGSNRQTFTRLDTRNQTALGDYWSDTDTFTPGSYLLTQNKAGVQLQGQVTATFLVGNLAGKGYFGVNNSQNSFPLAMRVCDSEEMFVSSSGSRLLTRQISMPAVGYNWVWQCTTGATGSAGVSVTMVPSTI